MDYYKTPEYLKLKAAINRKYAEANRATYAATGGQLGSLYMAEVHDACALIAERQSEEAAKR